MKLFKASLYLEGRELSFLCDWLTGVHLDFLRGGGLEQHRYFSIEVVELFKKVLNIVLNQCGMANARCLATILLFSLPPD